MDRFHLSDVLSVTTGMLVSTRNMRGVYDILNHMVGSEVYTHNIPKAISVCCPSILRQYPELAEVSIDVELDEDARAEWLQKQIDKYGEFLDILPLPEE